MSAMFWALVGVLRLALVQYTGFIIAVLQMHSWFGWIRWINPANFSAESKDGRRCLLDQVGGWVKPGTLTALMGASGAGKATLLDVLAQRTTVGVVTGDMLVNGSLSGADQRFTQIRYI
ncbi:hypothetical protein B0T26DRAFT_750832 [Lasiosphaeria miniovina]|uniref:ABC transporter domain-containing protein n=1 Tax=Lasiosphaeria miniovina TaxID=1954250 RepID=A0AA40AX36_9PEZI|nr:uncharacterized protein B0T26DRAFT_750832 [Lasiosphaeria miniovina]KAK0723567.1 hypothetical protein B0T26DRAFT_750832 [Lasiosphaeria miniovina]